MASISPAGELMRTTSSSCIPRGRRVGVDFYQESRWLVIGWLSLASRLARGIAYWVA